MDRVIYPGNPVHYIGKNPESRNTVLGSYYNACNNRASGGITLSPALVTCIECKKLLPKNEKLHLNGVEIDI